MSVNAASSPEDATPVVLVGVDFGLPHFDTELEELGLLAQTAGLRPVARITCKRKAPDAALFVGSGKADEIRMLAQMHGAREVLFDQALSPAQQRNLERHLENKDEAGKGKTKTPEKDSKAKPGEPASKPAADEAGGNEGPLEMASKKDYQLQQALNVLKVQEILQQKK